MINIDDIISIVGEEMAEHWLLLNPKVYMKNGEPFALIATKLVNDTLVIASTSKNEEPFTFGMNRDIWKMVKKKDKVMLISDCKDSCIAREMDSFHDDELGKYFTKGV